MKLTLSASLVDSASSFLMSKAAAFLPAMMEAKTLLGQEKSSVSLEDIPCFASIPEKLENAGVLVTKTEEEVIIEVNDKFILDSLETTYAGVEHLSKAVVPVLKYFIENSKAHRAFKEKLANISTFDYEEIKKQEDTSKDA